MNVQMEGLSYVLKRFVRMNVKIYAREYSTPSSAAEAVLE